MKAVHHDLIKQRAYAIWEQNGCPQGQDREHWEQAERELLDAAPAIEAKVAVKPGTESDFGSAAAGDALAAAPDRGNLEQEAITKSAPGRSRARDEAPIVP